MRKAEEEEGKENKAAPTAYAVSPAASSPRARSGDRRAGLVEGADDGGQLQTLAAALL